MTLPRDTAQTHHNQRTDLNESTAASFPSASDNLARHMDFNNTCVELTDGYSR